MFKEKPASKNSISNRRLIYGFGINNSDYLVTYKNSGKQVTCPIYKTWNHMLERCYSEKYHSVRSTYINCSVCIDWKYFMSFRQWMLTQDWQGKCLDKDIINPGNKIYRKDSCVFVSQEINSILNKRSRARGKYLIGVCWHKRDEVFTSQIRKHGRLVSLGSFDNESDAHLAYKIEKRKYLLDTASTQSDKRVADGLMRHAELLKC